MNARSTYLWAITAPLACCVAILAQEPLAQPKRDFTPGQSTTARYDGSRDSGANQIHDWLDSLSKGVPVEVIVTFKSGSGIAERRTGQAEASVPSDPEKIEERALAYAAVKRAAFASVGDEIEVLTDYSHIPVSFVRIHSQAAFERLQAQGDVEGIYENREQHPLAQPNLTMIGQPAVAAAGHKGSGVSVAVLDGPVDVTNSAFGCATPGSPSSCGVAYAKTFGTGGDAHTREHATNVAGIVLEVAPSSKVLSLDVFSGDTTRDSVWMQAANWCIANKSTYNIAALNMSFGGRDYTAPCYPSSYETTLGAVRQAGIIPVAAAGNDGSANALGSPACAPSAVSVGAVYDQSIGPFTWPEDPTCMDSSTQVDQVPCFSQSAFFLSLLAPGIPVTAAGLTFGGTSQAAPHVAGSVAVLRAGIPADTLGNTLQRLLIAGKPVTDGGSGITTPRLQLDKAWFGPYPNCKTSTVSLPFNVSGALLNDTCSGATSSGLVYYDNLYTFAGVTGQQVSAALTSLSFDTYLFLNAPDGTTAATGSATPGTTRDSQLSFTLTAAGTWTLDVSSYWPASTGSYSLAAAVGALETTCVRSATTLCLGNRRFAVTTTWVKPDGTSGTGRAIPLTDDTGAFWFFAATNYEMMLKTLNGCSINDHYWVFAGGLTNVKVNLTVRDTKTGVTQTYLNPQGSAFQPIQDTTAFSTCP